MKRSTVELELDFEAVFKKIRDYNLWDQDNLLLTMRRCFREVRAFPELRNESDNVQFLQQKRDESEDYGILIFIKQS